MNNGTGTLGGRPLEGWVIVMDGGFAVLGKPSKERTELEPAYHLEGVMPVQVMPGQKVNVALVHKVSPILGLLSLKSFPLSRSLPVIEVDNLDQRDRGQIANEVAKCEELMRHLRLESVGLHLAKTLPVKQ
jgi:hypothetical protein